MNIDKIVSSMTLEDKISFCTGANFWTTKKYEKYGIPALFMCDGPHGLRKQEKAGDMLGVNKSRESTCFPSEVTTASSWNPELLEKIGQAIGEEAKDQKVGLVLGPGANIKRNPLCGRNFEYFSEDPYLAGKLAAGFIRRMETQRVGSSLKHFALNSQEQSRFTSNGIVDERTLREIYLTAFEIAVKEGKPSTVMCSYPKINGVHASDSKELLTSILREQWGFDGFVVTDWGAMNDRIEGFKAGCDLNMPGGSDYMEKDVLNAVKSGALAESDIDESVKRILKLVFKAQETLSKNFTADYKAHHLVAKEAAIEGAVLLKNSQNILPLAPSTKIAIIGHMAKDMRFQGSGSSHINPTELSQPLECLQKTCNDLVYAQGCNEKGNTSEELLSQVTQVASQAEVAVVFAGLTPSYESEGFDRTSMKMPEGHIKMIETATKANPNTIVVLMSGSVVECPWADSVKAILYMGLPGQAGGEAIADLLYGKANPSGKLAESWPFKYEDVPSSEIYGKTTDALYEEGLYVGYRYYDKAGLPVRWPFGYGLSYTTFEYSDLRVSDSEVSVTVTNTGSVAGKEVVQMYVGAPSSAGVLSGLHRPVRELKGFKKISLQPGESTTVTFKLCDRSFAIWNNGWVIPSGDYSVEIGNLKSKVHVNGNFDGASNSTSSLVDQTWYDTCKGKPNLKDFEKLIGKTYVAPVLKKGQFTMDNTVMEMKDYSLMMKIMFKATEKTVAKGFGGKADYDNPDFKMMMASSAGAPLRSMQIAGGIKGGIFFGMLDIANGHFLRGIRKMIKR